MSDYTHSSVGNLSKSWDHFCLSIFHLVSELEERINKEKYASDDELGKLEALYDEISGTIDFDQIEEIVAYIQNGNS